MGVKIVLDLVLLRMTAIFKIVQVLEYFLKSILFSQFLCNSNRIIILQCYIYILCIIYAAVDCTWNDWIVGECTDSCGGGTRTNTRTTNTSAAHGGNDCAGNSSITEKCNTQNCTGQTLFFQLHINFQFSRTKMNMHHLLTKVS